MTHRYRICGKVKNSFILNGMSYNVGQKIDNCFMEREVNFVKSHCEDVKITDLKQEPIPIVNTPKKKTNKSVVSKNEDRRSNENSENKDT